VAVQISYEVAISGVQSTGAAGNLQLQRTQAIIGNIIQGAVGRVYPPWWLIDDAQDALWQQVNTAESADWAVEETQQNPLWQQIPS
jgi:hypothetical protein